MYARKEDSLAEDNAVNHRPALPLDLLVDVSSLQAPLTGIGRYTLEILFQLAQQPERVELRGFNDLRHYEPQALHTLLAAVDAPLDSRASNYSTVLQRALPLAKNVIKRIPGARRLRSNLQNKRIARASAQTQGSIYWQPNFILGETRGPSMVSVYDLSHERFPQFHPPERLRWLADGLTSTLEKADHIMTVSHFSKAEIVSVYGVPAERISVVYPGVAASFHCRYTRDELALVKQQYRLPAQYLLSLGTLEPRKNLKALIQAYAKLAPTLRQQFPLVLVGGQGWNHAETDDLIARLESRGEVIKLGYVPQAVIPHLYQSASAFAYVSLYEGFGMPVAEAMASGLPVLTSNCASMPEVADGCAELVDPEDIDSISAGLNKLLGELGSSAQGCAAARAVSANYSWLSAADSLLNTASILRRGASTQC